MRQVLLEGPGALALREVPTPEPGRGELVIRVDLALTCGTDLKTFRRGHPKLPFPALLGHEFTGTVARAGAGVRRFGEGDPVLAVHTAPCGGCDPCRAGLENLCQRIRPEAMALGAFADFLRIPAPVVARNVFLRPAGLDLRRGALLEPLACVVNGVAALDLRGRETVLVLGAGAIGLLFVALLKRRGVPRVAVLGKHEPRLALARRLGADLVIDLAAYPDADAAWAAASERGACAVVECVGRPEAWEDAIRLARPGGEVLLYGGCPAGATVSLDAGRLHYEALTLKGAYHFTPSDVRVALDLILGGDLPLEALVTGSVGLNELPQALAALDQGRGLKVAVVPARDGA